MPVSSRLVGIAFLVGSSLAVALVAWQGFGTVWDTLLSAGWRVVWLIPLFAMTMTTAIGAWWIMFPAPRPPLRALSSARWIGFAINQLLPVARIGGEIVRARLLLREAPFPKVVASVLADKTALVGSIVAFAALGLAVLARVQEGAPSTSSAIGVLALAFGAAGFYFVQRNVGRVGGWIGGVLPERMSEGTERVSVDIARALDDVYRARWRLPAGVALHTLFRVGLAVEVWWAAHWLGHPITFADAFILESLTQVIRASAFLVPGALGAQEGAFVLLGKLVGVPAPVALSISLIKRARELAVGIPGLVAWQRAEIRPTTKSSSRA